MANYTFPSWPHYSEDSIRHVSDVLRSGKVNYWTGDLCKQFESNFSDYISSPYCISVTNGTVALELSLLALGFAPGDEVIVTPRSFIASVSSVVRSGARPIFADVDVRTGNLTADTIRPHINSRTKAVLCVHLGGLPCDLSPIMDLCDEFNLKLIEDCSQAHGAQYNNSHVGTFGDIGIWSFCQDKIMSTGGEGGMISCKSTSLWNKIWSLKDHGKSFHSVFHKQHPQGFRWLHDGFGTNARMTEMQAALGLYQLDLLDSWVAQRNLLASSIYDHVRDSPILSKFLKIPWHPGSTSGVLHAFYRCYLTLDLSVLPEGINNTAIISRITNLGVPCFSGSCSEIYLENAFLETDFIPNSPCPNASLLGESSLAFLVHPTLSHKDIQMTINVLETVFTDFV